MDSSLIGAGVAVTRHIRGSEENLYNSPPCYLPLLQYSSSHSLSLCHSLRASVFSVFVFLCEFYRCHAPKLISKTRQQYRPNSLWPVFRTMHLTNAKSIFHEHSEHRLSIISYRFSVQSGQKWCDKNFHKCSRL